VNPYLTVRDVDWATTFYMKAFGFREKLTFKDKGSKSAHAYVTLGEMVGVLKGIFSEYLEPAVF
jgi:uncharacterized glyoxalase superfamily protein PhnB